MLFNVAFEAKLYASLVAMVIGVVVSIYYYFGWIREICFESKPDLMMTSILKTHGPSLIK